MTEDWTQRIEQRLAQMETRHAVGDVHRGNVEKRLAAIEDSLKWLVRLVMGAVVMALLAFVISGGFALPTQM
ncbi:pseudouridine synthase [Pelagovum sp. HNIBRBA483]|uniref:pseudouridine synthase n=1 Tax=Pelagovum sp. HNIBRBA483 TaxID=3233341 RepID=UPI0034A1ED3D